MLWVFEKKQHLSIKKTGFNMIVEYYWYTNKSSFIYDADVRIITTVKKFPQI